MRYVIIGGSAAGISAVEAIRSIDKESAIDLFTDEKTSLYSRVLLPYYVAEELSKPLLNFRSPDFFDLNNVDAHLGIRVDKISPTSKTIGANDGNTYSFDRLLLATGGHAIIPDIPGVDKEGISPLKTIEDAERIYRFEGEKAVVIGAGSIGVESCISLLRRGIRVTLLEQLGHVLPTVFDEEAAAIIRERIKDMGVEVITGERAVEFAGRTKVKGVVTDAREIDCDQVILSVGVTPALDVAIDAGLEVGSQGGIKTDKFMMTSLEDIYAAGDVSETFDIARNTSFVNAIWPMAVEQGRVAGLNMAGKKTDYWGSVRMNSIGNFIGIPAMSLGVTQAADCSYSEPECHFQEIKRRSKNTYKRLILRNGSIVGAIFVGQTQKTGIISSLLRKQIDVSEYASALMSDKLNFADLLPLLRRNGDKFTEPEFKELMDTGL